MAENPETIPNPGDSSTEIRHVPRMLEHGEQSFRIASTEGSQLATSEFICVLQILDLDVD